MMHSKQTGLKQTATTAFQSAIMIAALALTTGVAQAQQAAPSARTVPATVAKTMAPAPAQQMADEEESSAKPSKPGSEGIKVHGHWVLDVKNPDGSRAKRMEFNNSLVTTGTLATGDQLLAALLGGLSVAGEMGVGFISGVTPSNSSDPTAYCSVGDPGDPVIPAGVQCYGLITNSNSLMNAPNAISINFVTTQTGLSEVVNFSPSTSIVLSGNWTVPAGVTSLTTVQTYIPACTVGTQIASAPTYLNPVRYIGNGISPDPATITPHSCNISGVQAVQDLYDNAGVVFTSTSINTGGTPTPLSVTSGQVITVTVTLSFS